VDLVVAELQVDGAEVGLDIVAVLGHLLAFDEDGEGVTAVVGLVHLAHLHGVVYEVVLDDEGPQFAVALRSVVPGHVEPEGKMK